MVKKRVKKKSSAKKKSSVRKSSKKVSLRENVLNRYFLNSVILFAISLVLYYATGVGFLNDIFYFAMIIFGSLVLAFVIAKLVIFFLKILKK